MRIPDDPADIPSGNGGVQIRATLNTTANIRACYDGAGKHAGNRAVCNGYVFDGAAVDKSEQTAIVCRRIVTIQVADGMTLPVKVAGIRLCDHTRRRDGRPGFALSGHSNICRQFGAGIIYPAVDQRGKGEQIALVLNEIGSVCIF